MTLPPNSAAYSAPRRRGPTTTFSRLRSARKKRAGFLLADNRTFTEELRTSKIPHSYKEHTGSHEWGYWDTHIQEALAFHMKNLSKQSG